jgi:hypothetical protein
VETVVINWPDSNGAQAAHAVNEEDDLYS